MGTTSIVVQIIWTSLATASYQVLFSAAFALVLKVTKVWNFAQAATMGLAFYTIYLVSNLLAGAVWLGILAGCAVGIGSGYLTDRMALRVLRARHSPPLTYFIFTLILSQFVAFLLSLAFSTDPVFAQRDILWRSWVIGGIAVSSWDIVAILTTALVMVALWLFMSFTRLGQYLVAVAGNADLAQIYGIDRDRCYAIAMAIAGGLCAIGMYLLGSRLVVFPELPLTIMTFAVAATIVGGIGNIFGAALAALVINVIQQLSILVLNSQWQPLIVYGILFAVILVLPNGIRLPKRRIQRKAGILEFAAVPNQGVE